MQQLIHGSIDEIEPWHQLLCSFTAGLVCCARSQQSTPQLPVALSPQNHKTGPFTSVAAKGCDLSVTFQTDGFRNVPYGWTAGGQLLLEKPNNDSSQLAKVKLAAFPVPVIHVAPVIPLLGAAGSCAADCLPPQVRGTGVRRLLRRLAQALTDAAAAAAVVQAQPAAGADTPAAADSGEAPAANVSSADGLSICAVPSDPGNLVIPANWSMAWALDGGAPVVLGPFQGAGQPLAIKLDMLTETPKVRLPQLLSC